MIKAQNIVLKKGANLILKNVGLEIIPGEILAVLGPNGAGKSSLLKILTGFENDYSGNLKFNGRNLGEISLIELAKKRAVLSQQSSLNFPFTSFQVALMGRHPHSEAGETLEDFAIAEAALKLADVFHLKNRIYSTLSGGEQQRVQLARVLSQIWNGQNENYLFLDEPVSALDIKHQYMILRTAKSLAQKGVGIFCILHNLELVAQFADKILLLKDGNVAGYGAKNEILNKENLKNLFDVDDEQIETYLDLICSKKFS